VTGILKTDGAGERYILASSAEPAGWDSVLPVGMTNLRLGGGDFHYNPVTGAGQVGVTDGVGLNNVGLLVKSGGDRVRHLLAITADEYPE